MEWSKELIKVTQEVEHHFGNLTLGELNAKPDSLTWSIAQNLDHLIVVNETYFPVLTALKNGTYKTPFIGEIDFIVSFFGKTVLNAVQPDRKKKIKTFSKWEPSTNAIIDNVLLRFKEHQKQLQQKIDDAKPLVTNGVVIASPANKFIVYRLETAFDIIISHEQRHLQQAKEVLEQVISQESKKNYT